jgi:hypothetical protein
MELENGLYISRKKKEEVYDLFTKNIVSGRKGMWISKNNPVDLRNKYGFRTTFLISLKEYIVNAHGQSQFESSFFDLIDQFLGRYQSVIILVEDVEEIINDSYEQIGTLLKSISSSFLSKNMIFILALNGDQDEIKTKILEKDYGLKRLN